MAGCDNIARSWCYSASPVLVALSMSSANATDICSDLGFSPNYEVSETRDRTVGGVEYFSTVGLSEDTQTECLGCFQQSNRSAFRWKLRRRPLEAAARCVHCSLRYDFYWNDYSYQQLQ